MSANIQSFSFYAGDILRHLYDSFPLSETLSGSDFTRRYLSLDQVRLNDLKTKIDVGNLVKLAKEPTENQKESLAAAESEIESIERNYAQNRSIQDALFEGAKRFLTSEGYIRCHDEIYFQLTAKGFTALNREFEMGEFSKGGSSFIAALRAQFADPSKLAGAVSSGTIVSVISRLFGFG